LTLLEVGVTGSMRLSAPTASQPRGYKSGKGPVMLTSEAKEWSAVISSDNIPIQGEMWDVAEARQTIHAPGMSGKLFVKMCVVLTLFEFKLVNFLP
jgi:hypothetical protein